MITRIRRWLGKDAPATPAPPAPPAPPVPPVPNYTAQLEAWANNMRRTHLIAPIDGEVVWVPKSPKGSVWLQWRYMQMDPDMVSTRAAKGPTVKTLAAEDNLAHSPSRFPGQVW